MTAGANLFPVSPDRHATQIWQRFQSYAFVQDRPYVPIVLGEHEQVAATLPIIAIQGPNGLLPAALTRLGPRSAIVGANGVWRGSYVPSILRVHPFDARIVTAASGDAMPQCELLVDEGSGLIAPRTDAAEIPAGWEPFFTPEGKLAPVLGDIVTFFQARIAAEAKTRLAIKALQAAEFLTTTPPVTGQGLPEGVMWADPVALDGMGRSELARLHAVGGVALIHAMLISRHHLQFLAQAESQIDRLQTPVVPDSPHPTPESAALTSFLDALATARARENPEMPVFPQPHSSTEE